MAVQHGSLDPGLGLQQGSLGNSEAGWVGRGESLGNSAAGWVGRGGEPGQQCGWLGGTLLLTAYPN